MKVRLILWLLLLAVYAVYHFGFREAGGARLYRIDERIAFEVQPETDSFNGVSIRGYRRTNALKSFLCGACEVDYGAVDLPSAKYIRGDWVYTDRPEHEQAKTDLVNLRTSETINVEAAEKTDLENLPAYRERDLLAGEQYKLTAAYVKTNFTPLSTYTGTCVFAHLLFAALAFFIAFPQIPKRLLDAFAHQEDSYADRYVNDD